MAALYEAHALGLLRLAVIMLGDRQAAEDAAQVPRYYIVASLPAKAIIGDVRTGKQVATVTPACRCASPQRSSR